ncbi:MAG: hypothetical protein V1696_01805 [Candidatus Jorgensenbacteria bacterium]
MYYSMYYEPAIEPWQFIYLFVIGYATLPLIFVIVHDLGLRISISRIPLVFTFLALLGGFVLLTHWGWLFTFWLLFAILFGHAPLPAAILGTAFTILAFIMAWKAILMDCPGLQRLIKRRV